MTRQIAVMMALLAASLLMAPTWAEPCYGTSVPAGRIELPIRSQAMAPEGEKLISRSYEVYRDSSGWYVLVWHELERIIGYVGIYTEEITESKARAGEEPFGGLRIRGVVEDSPAARAGILKGDVLLSLDGERLSSAGRCQRLIQYHDREVPAEFTIRRAQQTLSVSVPLTTRSDPKPEQIEEVLVPVVPDQHAGLVLADIKGDLRKYFFAEDEGGVMTMQVIPGSPAFRSALRSGDIITSIDGTPVTTASQFDSRLGALVGTETTITLSRGAEKLTTTLEPLTRLPRESSFYVPLVVTIKKGVPRGKFALATGLLFDYERRSRETTRRRREETREFGLGWGLIYNYEKKSRISSSGEQHNSRDVGFLLNLIKYKSRPGSKSLRLLWLIHWNLKGDDAG